MLQSMVVPPGFSPYAPGKGGKADLTAHQRAVLSAWRPRRPGAEHRNDNLRKEACHICVYVRGVCVGGGRVVREREGK
jgi:hypothetical protein